MALGKPDTEGRCDDRCDDEGEEGKESRCDDGCDVEDGKEEEGPCDDRCDAESKDEEGSDRCNREAVTSAFLRRALWIRSTSVTSESYVIPDRLETSCATSTTVCFLANCALMN